jgi:hypothetical protein
VHAIQGSVQIVGGSDAARDINATQDGVQLRTERIPQVLGEPLSANNVQFQIRAWMSLIGESYNGTH